MHIKFKARLQETNCKVLFCFLYWQITVNQYYVTDLMLKGKSWVYVCQEIIPSSSVNIRYHTMLEACCFRLFQLSFSRVSNSARSDRTKSKLSLITFVGIKYHSTTQSLPLDVPIRGGGYSGLKFIYILQEKSSGGAASWRRVFWSF